MRIDIDYDLARIEQSKKRWDAAFDLSVADRPPVVWGVAPRLALSRRGKTFSDFFNDPIDQLINLIENFKWVAENLPGDLVTDTSIILQPQFENASNPNAFGCPVLWQDNMPPQALPAIATLDDLRNYQPPPVEETLWQKMIDYYHAWRIFLDDGNLKVTIRGAPVRLDLHLHIGGESPFMIATDLCGCRIYEWMHEDPDAVHRLLKLITERLIEMEHRMRSICGHTDKGRWFLADDTAQIISLEDFREFVVPYSGALYEAFAAGPLARVMHMCGRHTHLFPALLDDLKINGAWGYGSRNTPEEIRDGLGGKALLVGNIDPMILCEGPKQRIVAETRRLLDALLPCGGIMVCDGYNLIPETPIENLQIVVDTVESYCK